MDHFLYHGSHTPSISTLEPRSRLHDSDLRVIYLTANIPYALLYIWDSFHNEYDRKHVTGWIKNGITYYEEQFPNQLQSFYGNVSGSLYLAADTEQFHELDTHELMFYSTQKIPVVQEIHIQDVYQELLRYEREGYIHILRYNDATPQRQNELIRLIAEASIIKGNLTKSDSPRARFFQKHFTSAWEYAQRCTQ